MSRIAFNRKKVWIRKQFGVRARLILFACIIAGPLMVERIQSLQTDRAEQIEQARQEFSRIPQQFKAVQKEVLLTVSAILKPASYLYAALRERNNTCDAWKAALAEDLPWLNNLQVVDHQGIILCSIRPLRLLEPRNISAHGYFQRALTKPDAIVSDYVLFGPSNLPMLRAAYSASPLSGSEPVVILASINIAWLSDLLNGLGGIQGVQAVLVDNSGTVLAAPSKLRSRIGETMDNPQILHAIQRHSAQTAQRTGELSVTTQNGVALSVIYANSIGDGARLVVSIDTNSFSRSANNQILKIYLQLAVILVVMLLGATVAADQLIMRPINHLRRMATRFGQGNWSAPASGDHMPVEFQPLARALYGMAAQLRGREAELRASNDHLTKIAVSDPLSGLANRRGMQVQLEIEWDTAWRTNDELALLMIDIDHFKLYNDQYGHVRGDACLSTVGICLAEVAECTDGFAARYGGEEFCILLPGADIVKAARVAEMTRSAIAALAIPHPTSSHGIVSVSVGFASTQPHGSQSSHELIERADAALYAAKRNGRNMVVPNSPALEVVNLPPGRDRRAPKPVVTALNH